MSDEGDRACPLCAEEMDLTDQQLKPCKCGYEICVWCWHHIMDMAEKDQTQGRCPACRTPYNKEKIVGTAANCERLVAEMNMEKKMKSQKTKSKISVDGRKQLGSVRVIQRNLVYIVGLPLTLADEDLLHRKDYFGQYGRVLKISISRTAAGSIQQFANNTCSVYITYSKEEEAVRCIQSVHGFVLDGRPLRACFGTTKYCHAWLRNVPCTNPDCLYLHEIGTQEDRYSKDEIISAYSRVQQITSAASNMQRRSGNVLPPPADECHISSSTLNRNSISKSAANNATNNVNACPPKSTSGQYTALPSAASWGAHASNGLTSSGNLAHSNGPSKLKPGTCSTAVAAAVEVPHVHDEGRKKLISYEESQNHLHKVEQQPLESGRGQHRCKDSNIAARSPPVQLHCPPSPMDKGRGASMAPSKTASVELSGRSCSSCSNKDQSISGQGNNDNLPSAFASKNLTGLGAEHSVDYRLNGNTASLPVNHGQQRCYTKEFREPSATICPDKAVSLTDDSPVSREQSNPRPGFFTRKQPEGGSNLQTLGVETKSQVVFPKVGQHLKSLEEHKATDPESVPNPSNFSDTSLSPHYFNLSNVHSPTQTEYCASACLIQDPSKLDNEVDNGLQVHPFGISAVFNGYPEDIVDSYCDPDASLEHSYLRNKLIGRSEGEAANAEQSVATDVGESSIVSNILSLELDPWDESLTSPQNLVNLLGEADKRQGPLAPSNSWKAQNSNKSRFSFARADESGELSSHSEASFSHMAQMFKENPSSHDFAVNRDYNFDKFGDSNGFSTFNMEESDSFARAYSYLSSSKLSGSRSQASVPPGFSLANKTPPPGFTSHERTGPNFDSISGSHFIDTSLLGNSYQSPQTENISGSASADIEFMDPAILAVGKGRLPVGLNNGVSLDMRFNSSPQMNAVENEAFELLMQRSSPPIQNLRFSGVGNSFGPSTDSQNLPSRIMEQSVASSLSPFSQVGIQQSRSSMMSNGQWNGWNEGKSASEMGIAELLRMETLGFNSLHAGYEDSKFLMPSSGKIYSGTYGI